ncbi:hypothetical protein AAG906_027604 [Vitis piasezkii]
MASLFHLFLYITLLHTSINGFNGHSIKPPITARPYFTCGGGVFRYPFWHQDQPSGHCGYPGFGISCGGDGSGPVLRLSGDAYSIMKINYSENTLTLRYVDINNGSCPRAPHGVTLDNSSAFSYTARNKMLRFFYNCTLYPPSLPSMECLRHGTKRSYVFMVGAVPEFDWSGYCETTATVPVIEKSVGGDLVDDFGRGIREGFELTWRSDGGCRSCEDSGGFCGYGGGDLHRNFFCVCSGGRRSSNCHDNGVVPINILQPNFAAIGTVVFGGLMVAATFFYFIQRRKIGLYKPVGPVK